MCQKSTFPTPKTVEQTSMKLYGMLLAGLFLALGAMKTAAAVSLPAYEARIVPGYVVNQHEMIFQTANNLNDEKDTFYVNFANRQWTRTGASGVISGTWSPDQDIHLNPANPKGVLCLAGPWAFAGCLILVPVAWVSCQASATAAVHRAQRACQSAGLTVLIRDSGVCGQHMRTDCVIPSTIVFSEP